MSTFTFDFVRAQAKLSSSNARVEAVVEHFMKSAGHAVDTALGFKRTLSQDHGSVGDLGPSQHSYDHAENPLDAKANASRLRHEQSHPANKK